MMVGADDDVRVWNREDGEGRAEGRTTKPGCGCRPTDARRERQAEMFGAPVPYTVARA